MMSAQKGLCSLSGTPMSLVFKHNTKSISQVSIDRIDNSDGYIKGNVQLVALGINYMRNTFSLEDTKEFLDKLS